MAISVTIDKMMIVLQKCIVLGRFVEQIKKKEYSTSVIVKMYNRTR